MVLLVFKAAVLVKAKHATRYSHSSCHPLFMSLAENLVYFHRNGMQ